MTAVSAPPLATGASDSEVRWRKVAKLGAIGGVIIAFIMAIGMFETFDRRKVIDPFFSAGYLLIVWVPILMGYRVSLRPVLEGMEKPKTGAHNIIAGAATGAIVGAALGVFLLLADTTDLRGAFTNITPQLVDILSIGGSATSGAAVMTVGGAALGAIGGILHLLGDRTRMILTTVAITIVALNFLELVIGDILRSAGLQAVDRWIYTPSRGLRPIPAVLFAALAVGARLFLPGRSANVRQRLQGQTGDSKKRVMFIIGLGLIALGAFLPLIFGTYLNELLSNVGLFILLGLGLNVVIGYAGLLDLGYVAFFAVGAYTAALVTSPRSPTITPELAFFEALPYVLLMAAIAGLVIGTPVIRMRGDYLAIVTLGFGEIIRIALISDWLSGIFGGAQGIIHIAPLTPGGSNSGIRVHFGYVISALAVVVLINAVLRYRAATRIDRGDAGPVPGMTYSASRSRLIIIISAVAFVAGIVLSGFATWTIIGIRPADMFRIILVFVAIAAFVSWRLRESRVGRAWMAVREDEQIAQSMGINIVTTKLLAFVIGAMLASLGGALFAVKLGSIFPHSFEILQSIIILVVVIVGGMGSIRGVVMGAIVLIGILGGPTQPGLLREFGEYKLLVYGVILVWMMLQRPEGLWPEARRAQELHQEDMDQDAWLRAQADSAQEQAQD